VPADTASPVSTSIGLSTTNVHASWKQAWRKQPTNNPFFLGFFLHWIELHSFTNTISFYI
ncbi:MAG: hypothetical protein ACFFD2_14805, partial [Promethearchaeota archaeon]